MKDQRTIYLIEDDRNMRTAIRRMLHERMPEVDVVESDHADGVSTLLTTQHCDLLLLDIMLPDSNGLVILKELKSSPDPQIHRIPIIMLSGIGHRAVMDQAFKLGAVDYIVKPFDERLFLMKIRKWMPKQSNQLDHIVRG